MKRCPNCNVELKKRVALESRELSERESELTYSRPKLIMCLKCPSCGFSNEERKTDE